MRGKICSFTGHRDIYESGVSDMIYKTCERLIVYEGVHEFWVGNYGDFDKLAAAAVRRLKHEYPYIALSLVIPYLTAAIDNNKEAYYKDYDNILIAEIPLNTPRKYMIIKCNRYMIERSEYLIAYVNRSGGASKTLEYAGRRGVRSINIADCKI